MNLDVLCIGECLIDLISEDPAPTLAEVDVFRVMPGGAPANVAITAARLGARSGFVGAIGGDGFGRQIDLALAGAHVIPLLAVLGDQTTTAVAVTRSSGTPDFALFRGADAHLQSVPAEAVSGTNWIHTSAFALSEDPLRSAVLGAVAEGRAAGIPASIDLNYHERVWRRPAEPDLFDQLGLFDVVKVSVDDCVRMFGEFERDETIERLRSWGAGRILVTMGAGGVVLVDGDTFITQDVPAREVEDVTGAGDAFMAGFIIAHLDGLSDEDALRAAVEIAGRSVEVVGHLPGVEDRRSVWDSLSTGLLG